MLCKRILIILIVVLGIGNALSSRESFWELRKLMRQEEQLKTQQFNEDVNLWIQSLEQMGINFVTFVEQCRPLGSHCTQRHVQRHLRSLRRSCSELRAQLEALEIKYLDKISEEELLMPTLRAVRTVLQQYELTLRQVHAEAYKLVEQ